MNMFKYIYDNRHEVGRSVKSSGKPVFGCLSNYVPEEILHAGGVVPIRLRGGGHGLEKTARYLPSNMCSYLRQCMGEGIAGEYDYLDGFVVAKSCDAVRNFYSIWTRLMQPRYSFFIAFPSKSTLRAKAVLTEELEFFKSSLEEYLGKRIEDDELRRSIEIYNKNRSYMRRIRQMRLEREIEMSGGDFHAIIMAGYVMPKEDHNKLLEEIFPVSTGKISSEKLIPLAVSGNTFEDRELLAIIEKYGGNVILDNLSLYSPYYLSEVQNDGDPLSVIAERYLNKPVEPYRIASQGRISGLIQDMERYEIAGLVNLVQQYCDEYLMENIPLDAELKKRGIPRLFLDVDDTSATSKQLETRIQAFMEMISESRKGAAL